ncbi:subtilosin A family bacteriocin [Aneurinibacillus thermoaerophilus]|uniref:Subtilosin A family bacteriocin n=1 Tax=Aneurinibacillus thermoaerophilus TaxID=143495 RepID=A0ABX8YFA2_ANETH|nr:subtilosin A family bacteriocin [Aneurinibacillus thermoaerophilus]
MQAAGNPCAICGGCAACLADGPIPDFEGFGVSIVAGIF